MVTRIRGFRGKTRSKLSKHFRTKGKISLSRYFAKFDEGQKVCLKAEPAVQKGMYHPKYHGKIGTVVGKAGDCFKVAITDHKKDKTLIVHPIHLR